MRVTASKLRENIYRILDEAIETGQPVEIVRKGVVLRIVTEKPPSSWPGLRSGLFSWATPMTSLVWIGPGNGRN
jgi:hypothetical protein